MIQGSLVAVATPMHRDGSLDLERMGALIDLHHEQGTAAVVVLGTTGESPTLDDEEYQRLVGFSVEAARGRIPILAGIGANSTKHAVHVAKLAQRLGAVAGLAVVPYYNKPTQEGMYRHFAAVAQETGFPQVLYNIPGRTSCDMSNETILRLAELPTIIGIKDATSNMGRAAELAAHAPPHFALYAGDDDSALAFMLVGGHGTISVAANVAPQLVSELCRHAVAGEVAQARAINKRLIPLIKILTLQTNPIPIKYAMAHLGLIEEGIRLPMTWLDERHQSTVQAALRAIEEVCWRNRESIWIAS